MYVPKAYRAAEPRDIVRDFPFAMLVSASPDGPIATSVPIVFETDAPDETGLVGHMARANPHAEVLEKVARALAIFSGPHAYISASWYRENRTVPTWNYLAAQADGTIEPIDDGQQQLRVLARSVQVLESKAAASWAPGDIPKRVAALLPHIRSFRLVIERLEGATKLSQTQPRSDRERVIEALGQRGLPGDLAIAQLMARLEL
jgi:transcriptional regulator